MQKYRNKKTVRDGFTFDSKAEAIRYLELILRQRTGEISGLSLQHEFELIPKQAGERSVKYKADFAYNENGKFIVEDVKSKATITPVYIIKRKLMLERHGIRIREIMT